MDKVSGLKAILGEQLGWHKSRIDFFAQALIGLYPMETKIHDFTFDIFP